MSDFLLGVAQTAIGSGIGFVLGIIAFHYQQKQQSKAQSEAERQAALSALNRLSTAAGANIEALANAKIQLINEIRDEVDKMDAASKEVYEAAQEDEPKKLANLKVISVRTRHFYASFPRVSAMKPPDFREYSMFIKYMPALPLFSHRAVGMMQELNERIDSRNDLIAGHAREGATGDGMSDQRFLYYSNMLSDEGKAICVHVDDALDFWRLVSEQVKEYMTKKAKGEHFVEYKLVLKAEAELPKEELFPLMREQLVTFDD